MFTSKGTCSGRGLAGDGGGEGGRVKAEPVGGTFWPGRDFRGSRGRPSGCLSLRVILSPTESWKLGRSVLLSVHEHRARAPRSAGPAQMERANPRRRITLSSRCSSRRSSTSPVLPLVRPGLLNIVAELPLEHVVVVAELLLLVETDAVVAEPAAAEAVHARRVELPLGGVFGQVSDGHADATGQLDLGAGVVGHDGSPGGWTGASR